MCPMRQYPDFKNWREKCNGHFAITKQLFEAALLASAAHSMFYTFYSLSKYSARWSQPPTMRADAAANFAAPGPAKRHTQNNFKKSERLFCVCPPASSSFRASANWRFAFVFVLRRTNSGTNTLPNHPIPRREHIPSGWTNAPIVRSLD